MNEEDFDELGQFFGVYFNQDWPYEASTPEEIIDRYIASHAREKRVRVAELIDAFLEESDDDRVERELFGELGCDYTPDAAGYSPRGWMQHVAQRLRVET